MRSSVTSPLITRCARLFIEMDRSCCASPRRNRVKPITASTTTPAIIKSRRCCVAGMCEVVHVNTVGRVNDGQEGQGCMNDDDFAELFKPRKPSADASWADVAHEFQLLGKTL